MELTKLKALAAELPDNYKVNAIALIERMGEVIEGIGDTPITWKPSLLKLVQGTTDRSSLPKGVGIGDLVLGENKVDQPFPLIIIKTWTGRQMWSPDETESKILCSSPDAKYGYLGFDCYKCPHAVYDEETKKSECSKVVHALGVTEDLSDIYQVNFAKTGFATGRALEGFLKQAKVSPYKRKYLLSSRTHSERKNVEVLDVNKPPLDQKDTPAEIQAFLAELFNVINTERKETLAHFYEIIEDKRQQAAKLLAGGEAQKALTDGTSENGDSTIVLENTDTEGGESELAKSYSI